MKKNGVIDNSVKFVMFKRPFEEVINSNNLIDIELEKNVKVNNNFRVYPISQKKLLEDGYDKFKKNKYVGNMWGSKYLKAPDIFIKIKEKDVMVTLESIVTVETYLNTIGSDDFFFVQLIEKKNTTSLIKSRINNQIFEIENEFLTDFIESPRELESIQIDGEYKTKLFRIPEGIKDISKTKAYSYIQFGKKHNFKTDLSKQAYDGKQVLIACYMGKNHVIYYNPKEIISHRFFRLSLKNKNMNLKKLAILLNSTLVSLSLEIFRNPGLGGGVLAHGTYTIREFLVPDPAKIDLDETRFDNFLKRKILPVFDEIGIDPLRPIRKQEPAPLADRKELDGIIFDYIGLTHEEREEVYWSVCELVKERYEKANIKKKVSK